MICCAVHSALGCSVTLKCSTRRRSCARITNTKRTLNCGNGKEVDGDQLTDMVTQKSLPGLGWFFASLRHQARDRALRDFKAEFKKFTVNSRRAPRDVRVGHGPDQRADVRTYWRSSWCFRLRESPPIPFESIPLP